MWFAGLWITMRGVWQQKLDGKTAVLRLPTSTNEKKSFFLTESEIEPHGCWMDLVRSSKVAGRRLLSHLKGGTWNCLHTYRDKVIRQLLEQCWLPCILIYSLANLDFSSIPGEVGTSQASDMTVLLISTFCSGLPWLYFSFQLYWDMTDIQHCVSFKAWEVMWWNTTYYKMITSITLANTLSCHIITFFFFLVRPFKFYCLSKYLTQGKGNHNAGHWILRVYSSSNSPQFFYPRSPVTTILFFK